MRAIAALAAAFPVVAAAQALLASGACRDGVPNGMYELRTAAGQLRVAGAFTMERPIGTFLFWTAAGARIAVIPYDDGVRTGTIAAWYVSDRAATELSHRLEAPYVAGERHGVSRSWHENGTLRGEYVYEHGRLVDARGWTSAGVALSAAAAHAQAEQDALRDERFLESLERLVAEHRPRCPAKEDAAP
jgi:hypothetical protein